MNTHHHRIREYAYQIWESEGRPEGQEQRHWEMACKLADGGSVTENADQSRNDTLNFEDNQDQSAQPQDASTEPLAQLNPDRPLHPTEPVKSLIDTGPITEPVIAQVENIAPQKPAKLKKSKVSENEAITH